MALEFSYPAPACGEADWRPAILKNFHYLYFALVLCGLTAIVIVAVSLCTSPIPEEKASGALMLNTQPQNCPPPSILPPTPHHHSTWISTAEFYSFGLRSHLLPYRCPREGELIGLLILNCEAIHSIGKLLNELLLCARPYAGVTKMNGPARDCPRGETDTHTTETQADQAQGAG